MDASFAEVGTVALGAASALGVAIKYWLDRMTARQKAMEDRLEAEKTRFEAERIRGELKAETERLRWEAVMTDHIAEMRREISGQEREISYLRRISDSYLRHITVLEGLMRNAGMNVPDLVLPSHPRLERDWQDSIASS